MGEVTCSVNIKYMVEVCERYIEFYKEKNKEIEKQKDEEINTRYLAYKKTFTFFKKKTALEFGRSFNDWPYRWDTDEVEALCRLLKKSQDETVIINTYISDLLDEHWRG